MMGPNIQAYCAEGWTDLRFGKQPIRAALFDGAVWFAAPDLFSAASLPYGAALLASFSDEHRGEAVTLATSGNEGEDDVAVVSAVGALTIADEAPFPAKRILTKWLMARTVDLLTPPGGEAPHVPLAMLADGRLPQRPDPLSPHFLEWSELSLLHRSANSPIAQLRARRASAAPINNGPHL